MNEFERWMDDENREIREARRKERTQALRKAFEKQGERERQSSPLQRHIRLIPDDNAGAAGNAGGEDA